MGNSAEPGSEDSLTILTRITISKRAWGSQNSAARLCLVRSCEIVSTALWRDHIDCALIILRLKLVLAILHSHTD
jgi:hypothetical protein